MRMKFNIHKQILPCFFWALGILQFKGSKLSTPFQISFVWKKTKTKCYWDMLQFCLCWERFYYIEDLKMIIIGQFKFQFKNFNLNISIWTTRPLDKIFWYRLQKMLLIIIHIYPLRPHQYNLRFSQFFLTFVLFIKERC